jgi:hypothetical protein
MKGSSFRARPAIHLFPLQPNPGCRIESGMTS